MTRLLSCPSSERILPGLQAGPAARRRHRHRERGDAGRLPEGLARRRAAPPGLRRDGAHHGHGARDHGGKSAWSRGNLLKISFK